MSASTRSGRSLPSRPTRRRCVSRSTASTGPLPSPVTRQAARVFWSGCKPLATAIPVICLTGYLGAGKTTLLNHVLRSPGARIGVIINDFGELNVDAMLVAGQIDEPVSIAGGCICCLPDDGGIDEALAKFADPRLNLDAIIVEASGLAEPIAVARMIGFSEVPGVRFGGLVDVIDVATHFE